MQAPPSQTPLEIGRRISDRSALLAVSIIHHGKRRLAVMRTNATKSLLLLSSSAAPAKSDNLAMSGSMLTRMLAGLMSLWEI